MDTSITRAGFNIGMFFGVISGLLLIFQEPGTAEFIITAFTAIIDLTFAALVILVSKLMAR